MISSTRQAVRVHLDRVMSVGLAVGIDRYYKEDFFEGGLGGIGVNTTARVTSTPSVSTTSASPTVKSAKSGSCAPSTSTMTSSCSVSLPPQRHHSREPPQVGGVLQFHRGPHGPPLKPNYELEQDQTRASMKNKFTQYKPVDQFFTLDQRGLRPQEAERKVRRQHLELSPAPPGRQGQAASQTWSPGRKRGSRTRRRGRGWCQSKTNYRGKGGHACGSCRRRRSGWAWTRTTGRQNKQPQVMQCVGYSGIVLWDD